MWPVMRWPCWSRSPQHELTPRGLAEAGPNDLALARLAKDNGFMAQACYHASQAAEKGLKGSLLELGIEPPHTHVLNELVQRLGNEGLNVASLEVLPLRGLSRMAIQSRYPVDTTAPADLFDLADAEQAIRQPKPSSTLWPPSTMSNRAVESQPSESGLISITGPLERLASTPAQIVQVDRRDNSESRPLIVKLPTQDVSALEAESVTHSLGDRDLASCSQ